jgi:quercetin dioxygenase-like cupin family protein
MKKEIILSRRERIQALQDLLIHNADGENIEGDGNSIIHSDNFPLKHTFADGIYVRQMDMKAGSVVIGAIHNHLHVWFLLSGKLEVAKEDSIEEFIAPCYVLANPGSKRVIHAVEDSIFINIHKNPSNTENIDKLEEEIVSKTFEEYEQYINKNK